VWIDNEGHRDAQHDEASSLAADGNIGEQPGSPPGLVPATSKTDEISTEPQGSVELEEALDEPSTMSIAERHRQTRLQKRKNPRFNTFLTSPPAISSEDRDTSEQGRFDMSALYQMQLRNDRYCMIVDFANGRILSSNALSESLFEPLAPLAQREVVELIDEEDRLSFSACIMYLTLGKFASMDPKEVRINTYAGVQRAVLLGNQLEGFWWWLDFSFDSLGGGAGASSSSLSA
jgi:hypothetical protein